MENQPDMVLMKNGKMMVRQHGEMRPMDMAMTLENGTRVLMDGTVQMPDGTSHRMMEGDAMTMSGDMTTVQDMKTTGNMDRKEGP